MKHGALKRAPKRAQLSNEQPRRDGCARCGRELSIRDVQGIDPRTGRTYCQPCGVKR